MDQIWQNYISRFEKPDNLKDTEFFTQLGKDYTSKLTYLYDIESFCVSLMYAKLTNQKICIYSDYDTDAVTATATMYWGLLELGFKKENISYYAPDRFTEGYGMNPEAVEQLALENDLIISVDCGINSVLEVKKVREVSEKKVSLGLNPVNLIITDHHHLQGQLPDCEAVINPRVAVYLDTMADVKKNLSQKRDKSINDKLRHLKELNLINLEKFNYITNWANQLYSRSDVNQLSSSVTGVGVAWFSLVWASYALNEWEQVK